ncbi:ORF6N domain-containing protein [Sodalis sp.]|uniref:ORF6N domain-containing protein n=1 Tax=Sodalis sp. (in: enterobacteria) TaxID=1898979 RepID=UPI0038731179
MTKIITIENTQLPVIEWNGVRVVTTETLAVGYGTNPTNIRSNLTNHKSRFIDGVHYFTVEGMELADLRVNNIDAQISSKARTATLWTEKGAARMSKIVDTDEAWSFFEKLENAYFKQQALPQNPIELGLPNFLDPAEAAIAWGQERKAVQRVTFERDHAIRTKAEIGSRREATAMAKASAAVRERNKLAEKLGECTKHATIVAVMNKTGKEYPWRPLRQWCLEHGGEIIRVPDARYGTVNSWPAEAWKAVHEIDLRKLLTEVAHA